MIEFRCKEFARVDSINDFSSFDVITRPVLEIIKAIEMMQYNGGDDVGHWINDKVIKPAVQINKKLNKPIQLLFSLAIEKDYKVLSPYFGSNLVNLYIKEFKDWAGYLDATKNKLLTETKQGKAKYSLWFDTNPITYSNKEYREIMKFIALAISGQINYSVYSDYWTNFNSLSRDKVNYSVINPLFMKCTEMELMRELKFMFANILSGLCYVPLTYKPIQYLLND